MGNITTQLDILWGEKQQRERVIEARAQLQMGRQVLAEINAHVQTIVDGGALNTIPTEIKTALNKAWAAIKTAQTALAAVDVAEALDWAGK
jgi:hypothetical protein